MVQSILTDLYHGNVIFSTENQNISRHWAFFYEALKAQDPELEKSFDVLRTDVTQIYLSNAEEMFYQGFSFAVKLLAESLAYP